MSQTRAYDTCMEMLLQRDYQIIDQDSELLRIIAQKPDNTQICVIFNTASKFDSKSLKEIISTMKELEINHSIVIYRDSITPATKNTLSQSLDINIELFAEEDLQYNITKHRLQPQFQRLSDTDAEEFKKNYGTKFGTLRIEKPIARFYGYKRGDVIRIIRPCGFITYRIVKG